MEKSMVLNRELFGERIKCKRMERGLTREALAEKLDCSVVFLAEVESGKKLMRLEKLYYMALILDTGVDYILNLEDGYSNEENAQRQNMFKDANDAFRGLKTKDLQTAVNIVKAFSYSVKCEKDNYEDGE